MLLLLDANVIFAGVVGKTDGPSAILLATIRLGGFEACTVDNAMEEAGRHLHRHFNRDRLKAADPRPVRILKSLRECPTFTVHPWINASPQLLPSNPKDAYLIEAARLYRPAFLLTWDKALLDLDVVDETTICTPQLLLGVFDQIDADDF